MQACEAVSCVVVAKYCYGRVLIRIVLITWQGNAQRMPYARSPHQIKNLGNKTRQNLQARFCHYAGRMFHMGGKASHPKWKNAKKCSRFFAFFICWLSCVCMWIIKRPKPIQFEFNSNIPTLCAISTKLCLHIPLIYGWQTYF